METIDKYRDNRPRKWRQCQKKDAWPGDRVFDCSDPTVCVEDGVIVVRKFFLTVTGEIK